MTTAEELRDRLLLAFTELAGYGVATREGAPGPADAVAAELVARLRARHPGAIGSYAFWLRADDGAFECGALPPLYTSGVEVDRALAAALDHQGLAVPTR